MNLTGKTVIVVGASGGLGSAICSGLRNAGANLVISARDRGKLESLRKKLIAQASGRVVIAPADITISVQTDFIISETLGQFDRIDGLVLTAGKWQKLSRTSSHRDAESLINEHLQIMLAGPALLAHKVQQVMVEQGDGLIANISSHAAVRPHLRGNLSYGPAKAGVRNFMLALREELWDTGVRVVDIQPAIVNTEENAKLLDTAEKKAKAVQPKTIADWIVQNFDNPDIPAEILFDSDVVV